MPRFAFGVTLTPAERALVGGYPGSCSGKVREHRCVVTLPDEAKCQVTYTRYNSRSHKFDFGAPLHQRIWIDPYLDGSVAAVEQKAQEIAPQAFTQAQEAEQKAMRRKSLPPGTPRPNRKDPNVLSCKAADQAAGKYAVCLKFASGQLRPVGPVYDSPEDAAEEIQSGKFDTYHLIREQAIVIGICNRGLRRWQEPALLVERPCLRAEADNPPLVEKATPKSKRPTGRRSQFQQSA